MTLDLLEVAPAVSALRPDFAALALLVSGVRNGPTTPESDAWLQDAEDAARAAAHAGPHPHVLAWHEAFRAFGAKPQRTASSVDAQCQRAVKGQLPRVNWLVDLYNAIIQLRPDWHSEDDKQGVIKIVMTGNAADPLDWQQHVRTKARREEVYIGFCIGVAGLTSPTKVFCGIISVCVLILTSDSERISLKEGYNYGRITQPTYRYGPTYRFNLGASLTSPARPGKLTN